MQVYTKNITNGDQVWEFNSQYYSCFSLKKNGSLKSGVLDCVSATAVVGEALIWLAVGTQHKHFIAAIWDLKTLTFVVVLNDFRPPSVTPIKFHMTVT